MEIDSNVYLCFCLVQFTMRSHLPPRIPFLLLLLEFTIWAQGKVAEVDLVLKRGWAKFADDAERRNVILVNDQFPGPEIRCTKGDTVVVTVHNMMTTESTTIHFHGLLQTNTSFYDGTAGITQCMVAPDDSFTHKFKAEEAGTYWYHPHVGMSRLEGGYGAFIIEDSEPEPFTYDSEASILVNEWYGKSLQSLETGLLEVGSFTWVGDGSGIQVNGASQHSLQVVPGSVHRLRVINVASLHFLTFTIEGHDMTIVEADGSLTQPVTVRTLGISPGQRYSVLVRMDQPVGNYSITWNDNYRGLTPDLEQTMVLQYVQATAPGAEAGAESSDRAQDQGAEAVEVGNGEPGWELRLLKSRDAQDIPDATREIKFKVTQEWVEPNGERNGKTATASLKWLLNGVPFKPPSTPYLLQSAYGLDPKHMKSFQEPVRLEKDEVVDVVLQNGAAGNGVCEQHPLHLHGHKFWVIAQGSGSYGDGQDVEENLVDPIRRDTVTVFPRQSHKHVVGGEMKPFTPLPAGQDCGWVKFRFVADNPGMWFMHCHTDWHALMGMGVVFDEYSEDLWERVELPPDWHTCGDIPHDQLPKSAGVVQHSDRRPVIGNQVAARPASGTPTKLFTRDGATYRPDAPRSSRANRGQRTVGSAYRPTAPSLDFSGFAPQGPHRMSVTGSPYDPSPADPIAHAASLPLPFLAPRQRFAASHFG